MPLLRSQSLKEVCISRLEEMILSGEFKPGERLPAERDLSNQLGISRPVLHEALVELAAKGLVTILPRHGVRINDYRTHGSVAILSSLLEYQRGNLDPQIMQSMMDMRILVEDENARLAALNRTPQNLAQLDEMLVREEQVNLTDIPSIVELDFDFHLAIAIASGNLVYPLIINSFKTVYTSLTGEFFAKNPALPNLAQVHAYHQQLVEAIRQKDPDAAAKIMREMLVHGEKLLKGDN